MKNDKIILEQLYNRLIEISRRFNWNNFYGKWSINHSTDQSLFMHSLNQASLDIVLINNSELSSNFTLDDKIVTIISSYVSDIWKSSEAYQKAVLKHINKSLTVTDEEIFNEIRPETFEMIDNFLEEFYQSKAIQENISKEKWDSLNVPIKKAVCYHEVTKYNRLIKCSKFGTKSKIEKVIDIVDKICSNKEVEGAYNYAQGIFKEIENLTGTLRFTYHKLNKIRGIITVILNKSLIEYMESKIFSPLLYFSDGILYYTTQNKNIEFSSKDLKNVLEKNILEFFNNPTVLSNKFEATFGDPRQTIVVFPQFLEENYIRLKLQNELLSDIAINKKFDSEFNKIKKNEKYFDFLQKTSLEFKIDAKFLFATYLKFRNVFVFYWGILDTFISWSKEQDFEEIENKISLQFPFAKIKDIKKGSVGGATFINKLAMMSNFFRSDSNTFVLTTPENLQNLTNRLIISLEQIFEIVKSSKPKLFEENVLNPLLMDILYPILQDPKVMFKQLQDITKSSFSDKNKKESKLCFFCGNKSKKPVIAELAGDGSEKFSNQLIGGKIIGKTHKATLCSLCELEATMRKLIMGTTPQEVILLEPEMNMTSKIDEYWKNQLDIFIKSRNRKISLLNNKTLSKVIKKIALSDEQKLSDLNALWLSKNIIVGKEKTKKLEKLLTDRYGQIQDFNFVFSTNFTAYKDLIDASSKLEWWHKDLSDIFGESKQTYYFYETPNYILIFLSSEIKDNNKEPPSESYFYKLFFGTLLSLIFCSKIVFMKGLNPLLDTSTYSLIKIPRTSIIYALKESLELIQEVYFHNRLKILKKLCVYFELKSMDSNAENDFILKVLSKPRGFLLRQFLSREKASYPLNKKLLLNLLSQIKTKTKV